MMKLLFIYLLFIHTVGVKEHNNVFVTQHRTCIHTQGIRTFVCYYSRGPTTFPSDEGNRPPPIDGTTSDKDGCLNENRG